jgi:cyclopropane-fatty-acyl-phospholipid synthase
MLYKFKSKATGDLIMLEPQGKQILKLIGKEAGAEGIILPSEMMAAIDALHAAVEQEALAIQAAKDSAATAELQAEALAIQAAKEDSKADDASAASVADGPRTISLKQRVVPFIDMLRRAYAEDKEVVWGV